MSNCCSPCRGHGPWGHLPPPMRPGWWFRGRGRCWWWAYPTFPAYPWMSKEAEIEYLENLKKNIDVVVKELDARLKELKEGKS